MRNNKLWEEMLDLIKLEISPNAFNTWFKGTSLEIKEENNLIVYAGNEFASDWIRKNYSKLIKSSAEKILEKEVDLKITSKNDEEASETIGFFL